MVRRLVGSCALAIVACLAFGPRSLAQVDDPAAGAGLDPSIVASAIAGATALVPIDGVLMGIAQGYKVEFSPEGFRYTMHLGPHAPRPGVLAFELDSIRCGDVALLERASPTEPHAAERTVTYARGPSIREEYHVRPDGLEQTVVFDALPELRGEIVVRGRVTTELVAVGVDGSGGVFQDGIRFEFPGYGELSYGGVTGIDAKGRTARGELRFDGEWLELVLPGDFVADAALPLVLDPLISANGHWLVSASNLRFSDIAFDATYGVYLVAWLASSSSLFGDIYGLFITPEGTPNPNLLAIESNTNLHSNQRPTVANNNGPNRFLVAWSQSPSHTGGSSDLACRIVNAWDGGLSNTLLFAADGTSLSAGGEAIEGYPYVHVVWIDAASRIRGAALTVLATGGVAAVDHYVVHEPTTAAHGAAISKSGGAPGRYLVTWTDYESASAVSQVRARVVHYNGVLGPPPITISVAPLVGDEESAVDGDGTNFAVLYNRLTEGPSGLQRDVVARRVQWGGAGLVALPGVSTVDELAAFPSAPLDIVMVGGTFHGGGSATKYAAVWSEAVAGQKRLWYRELDPVDCTNCGSLHALTGVLSEFSVEFPALASEVTSGGSGSTHRGMATFIGFSGPGFANQLYVRPFEALGSGGSIVDLGGGCAGGGTASTVGPFAIGNKAFRFELTGAWPGASFAVHNLAVAPTYFPCGSCLAFLGSFQVLPATLGTASYTIPIPCEPSLIGIPIDQNWIVLPVPTSPCPLFPNVANSNVLRLTIGE